MSKGRPRPTETPKTERNAPRPPAVTAKRRHLDVWGPIRLGVVLWCVAWPTRWLLDAQPPGSHTALGWLLLLWGLVWGFTALVIRRHVTHRAERHAAGLTLAAAGLWTHAVWWQWAPWTELFGWLAVGLVVAVGLQALNHREWARGRIRADIDAWPDLMRNTPWADVYPVGDTETIAPGVIRRRFRRRDKADTSVKDLLTPKARERYEERHHLDDGSVRVERDGKSHDDLVVTEVRRDPHAGRHGITWNGKVLRHIWDDLVVAYYEDGRPEVLVPWRRGVGPRHGLIAGLTGSGKSTLMRLLACAIAPAEEAVTVMVDCKGGQSFGRLAALFSWFQHDVDDALRTLEGLVELMRWRQARAREWGWSGFWRPSRTAPVYFVFVDELARLIGVQAPSNAYRNRALSLVIQLVQEGRSTGFCFIGATQYPTVEAIGSSQFKSQIDWRVCFRMAEEGQDQHVLTNKPTAVDASRIDEDRNGTCYIQNGSKCRTIPARALNVPDGVNENGEPDGDVPDVVTPVLHDWWDRTTPIPDEEIELLDSHGAWSDRTIYGPDGETYVTDPDTDEPARADGVTMSDLDADDDGDRLHDWLAHELPGVPAHTCGTVPTAGAAVMGLCHGCGEAFPEPVAAALRVVALDSRPAPRRHLHSVPAPQEPAMTAAAEHLDLAAVAAAHQPTDTERAADEAALARMQQAYPSDDTPTAREAAWRLFVAAGAAGLSPVEVYRHDTVRRSDSWGYKRIAEWREAGYLVQLEAGRHRVADQYLTEVQ